MQGWPQLSQRLMKKISSLIYNFLPNSYIDAIDVAVIDFNNGEFKSKLHSKNNESKIFFDLASVSKPLVNGIGFLVKEKSITPEMELVLNHRGGLPAWGLLSKSNWKKYIQSFPIEESETLYSDFSALRFMLEFNEAFGSLRDTASLEWDKDIKFWKDLSDEDQTVQNGYIDKKPNLRCVHDPNAYNLDEFVSHAGLFGTSAGVSKTLINLNTKYNLLEKMNSLLKKSGHRFNGGWDRVENVESTFAGLGCSKETFGHLGFTGTSIWIDTNKNIGHVILANATKHYWFDMVKFNTLRKSIAAEVWS